MPDTDLVLLNEGQIVQSFSGVDFSVLGYIPPYYDIPTEPNDKDGKSHRITSKAGDVFIHDMASIQTMSISSTRDTKAARKLGSSWAFDFSRGSRSVAGSLVFATLDGDAFSQFIDACAQYPGQSREDAEYYSADALPPFNIAFQASNESGTYVTGLLLGVRLINTGMSFGIHDIYTEQVYSYVAARYEPLRNISDLQLQNPSLLNRNIEEELRRLYGETFWRAPNLHVADDLSRRYERFPRNNDPQPQDQRLGPTDRLRIAGGSSGNVFEV